MEQARIVLTTVSSHDEARKIARSLIEARLAACVSVIAGLHSTYHWQGAIEEADELQLVIKTSVEKIESIERALHALHSYEVPEFLVLAVDGGSGAYLQWLYESVE